MLYLSFKLMKAGIKIGLRDYKEKIPVTKATICEVYFRFDKKDQYFDLFKMLNDRNITAGVHFWSVLPGNILYNLSYPDEKIRNQTVNQIKETVDLVSNNKLKYVNVHPGNYRLVGLNLDEEFFVDLGKEVPEKEGKAALFDNVRHLTDYARQKGVLFLTETVPSRYNMHWYNDQTRLKPVNLKDPSVNTLIELSKEGNFITNDFCHTIADEVSDDTNYLFDKLRQKTIALAPKTKLIHLNTSRPPFNGTDTHNGVLDEDFLLNVLPNRNQIIELLGLFKNRNDVWLIPEPLEKHEENFQSLQKIVDQFSLEFKPL